MRKWELYSDTYIALHVLESGKDRYCVCTQAEDPRKDRELARFKTREEARAFEQGLAMAAMEV